MEKTLKTKAIDLLDHKILCELQGNARISNAEIGRRVGLSAPAVGERITKLEDYGYIDGYRTLLNPDKMGLSIQAMISFRSGGMKLDDMVKMMESLPEIAEWYNVTGNYCFILKAVVATSKQLEELIVLLN